jgi:hypothetical protein
VPSPFPDPSLNITIFNGDTLFLDLVDTPLFACDRHAEETAVDDHDHKAPGAVYATPFWDFVDLEERQILDELWVGEYRTVLTIVDDAGVIRMIEAGHRSTV